MGRFKLIQGGLSEAAPADPDAPEAVGPVPDGPDAAVIRPLGLRIDLRGAAAVDEPAVGAWRALLTRIGRGDPFEDPDYLLTAAQHQAAGHEVAFALAWRIADGPGGAPERLHGVLGLRIARRLLVRDRAHLWYPPGTGAPARLVEPAQASEFAQAVKARLGALPRPVHLDADAGLASPHDPQDEARAPRPARLQAQPGSREARRRGVPPASLLGVRPEGYRPPSVEHVRDPARVRDAVETFLALDARTARRPIIADPSEAAMVRVVSRLFARRRQMSVELARSGGTVVSGTLHLGSGPRAVAWRHAAD